MPADSSFAIAMRTQQEAEKAEKQRIKKLVLNYDLHNEDEDAQLTSNGEDPSVSYIPLEPNLNKSVRIRHFSKYTKPKPTIYQD